MVAEVFRAGRLISLLTLTPSGISSLARQNFNVLPSSYDSLPEAFSSSFAIGCHVACALPEFLHLILVIKPFFIPVLGFSNQLCIFPSYGRESSPLVFSFSFRTSCNINLSSFAFDCLHDYRFFSSLLRRSDGFLLSPSGRFFKWNLDLIPSTYFLPHS